MTHKPSGNGNTTKITERFKKRFTEDGLICLGCNKAKANSEYPGNNKNRIYSRCKICLRDKVREKKKKFKKFIFNWN